MVAAFGIAYVVNQHVFVNYSPEVRRNMPRYIAVKVGDTWNSALRLIGQEPKTKVLPTESNLEIRAVQIAPGVRASSIENANYTEIDTESIEYKKVEIKKNDGSTVVVEVPKNSNTLPPASLLE